MKWPLVELLITLISTLQMNNVRKVYEGNGLLRGRISVRVFLWCRSVLSSLIPPAVGL